MPEEQSEPFVISAYTRKQAIEDGVLTPIDPVLAARTGFYLPSVVAENLRMRIRDEAVKLANHTYPTLQGDEREAKIASLARGGTLDMLKKVSHAIHSTKQEAGVSRVYFPFIGVQTIVHIGPDDEGKPCFTFMDPSDD